MYATFHLLPVSENKIVSAPQQDGPICHSPTPSTAVSAYMKRLLPASVCGQWKLLRYSSFDYRQHACVCVNAVV